MNTRDSFCADWAFGIRGAIENFVRRAYPSELRRWPLLQTFDFDAFAAGNSHFVIIMRDKLGGIVAGPGVPTPFPHSDHPSLPRRRQTSTSGCPICTADSSSEVTT